MLQFSNVPLAGARYVHSLRCIHSLQATPSEPVRGAEAGGLDPFGGDPLEQEKLAAIARSFEEKYVSIFNEVPILN